jgi:indole-3-glycerol phosphate synthase
VTDPPDLLTRLVHEAEAETEARRALIPFVHLERLARALPGPRDFAGALRRERGLGVVAEMKARTPVMGTLADPSAYSPSQLARIYTAAGAAAISVLCQATSFGGRPEHLAEARAVTDLPVLRKDFVCEEYPVVEARAYGADAVLLIVAALTPERLRELLDLTRRLGMEALVEVHDEAEVDLALAAGASVIGVNHRDLRTFEVDLSLTGRLRPLVPEDRILVAESGIHSGAEARLLLEAGAQAVLVGEALMRADDPAAKVRELAGVT